MSPQTADNPNRNPAKAPSGQYVVVARRYRPQSFEQLVGQNQVGVALSNAIETNRVGHAYLFTGARGVGKTSTARIFAKALNCVQGPTPTPCNECDICQGVATGEDVDVLEIDGASNRGIDEIRQLRSNANIRPSRARYKIYIIDEVHMLTTPAFNALLKTLEEPPEHVKFIFCTTDPEKIPITVLSRCQRFDFAPVETASIVERLRFIADAEGVQADAAALQLLARRAAGSMRDSQSLLEQLLSFRGTQITVDDVHAMLGTARGGRLAALADHLTNRNASAALAEVDAAVAEGVDVGQFAEQMLGYFRDMMATVVGCDAELLLHSGTDDFQTLVDAGQKLGLETILAIVQILDQTLVRMRQSTHVRTLVEVALVRICHLEDLDNLSTLIGQLQSSPASGTPSRPTAAPTRPAASSAPATSRPTPAPAPAQKKNEPIATETKPVHSDTGLTQEPRPISSKSAIGNRQSAIPDRQSAISELTPENVPEIWAQVVAQLEGMTADYARSYASLAIPAPNRLVVRFSAQYTLYKESCERPAVKSRIEQALADVTGCAVRIDFETVPGGPHSPEARQPAAVTKRQQRQEMEKYPLVRQAIEMFDAEIDFNQSRWKGD